ncbi:MAG: DUF4012 domain-containing protein [Anaerolineae bacterium]|nr:DUF4012 domain-containing protein [Anaerolineae bacterium]
MSVKRQYIKWAALGVLLLGIVLLGVWGVGVYRTLRSLQTQMEVAQELLSGDPLKADPASLSTLLHTVRRDVLRLKRDVGWLAPLGRAFHWLPKVGPLIGDAPALLSLADNLTEAGVIFWEAASPSLAVFQQGGEIMTMVADALPQVVEVAPQAQSSVSRARVAFAALDIAAYPYQLRNPLMKLEMVFPLLEDVLPLVPVAPSLLGLDVPRTYLVLALNEDELRPGGGFITGVGEVHISAGKLVSMTFTDSYRADDFSQPYPWAPEPLQQLMAIQPWVFRDSNWSPDFPTAVRQALALYRPGHSVTVDGVIALDQYAVQQLVAAVGPISLPGSDEPVTAETLMTYIYHAWEPEDGNFKGEWWLQHKSFMQPLAQAVIKRVQTGNVDWEILLRTCLQLVEGRHLMVYLTESEAADVLAERGWDGSLRTPDADFLMLVEANVGYNKASTKIQRALAYQVDLTQSMPQATVTLAYTHTSEVDIACIMAPRYDAAYQQMMDRCYWNYLRLYVPQGAALTSFSRHPIPAEFMGSGQAWDGEARVTPAPEGAYTVFSQAMLLPTRSQMQLSFAYTLPARVVQQTEEGASRYHLWMQKQAGLRSIPVRIVLHLPQTAVLLSVQPSPTSQTGGLLFFERDLSTDLDLEVVYRLP